MIKAVVFDLDDTLISEYEYIQSGYKHISEIISEKSNIDKDKIYTDLITLFDSNSKKVFNQLLDNYKIEYNTDEINTLVNEYRSHIPNIKLYDDVLLCIKELKEQNIKIGLITDGYAVAQKNKISSLEIDYLFDYIIVTDDYGRDFWKPSPKPFELMQENMSVNFNEMVYIGDNPEKDFYIQSIHPIHTIRINRPLSIYKNSQYLSDYKEHMAINSLDELFEYIKKVKEEDFNES